MWPESKKQEWEWCIWFMARTSLWILDKEILSELCRMPGILAKYLKSRVHHFLFYKPSDMFRSSHSTTMSFYSTWPSEFSHQQPNKFVQTLNFCPCTCRWDFKRQSILPYLPWITKVSHYHISQVFTSLKLNYKLNHVKSKKCYS